MSYFFANCLSSAISSTAKNRFTITRSSDELIYRYRCIYEKRELLWRNNKKHLEARLMKQHLTLIRVLVIASVAVLAAAATVTPMPEAPSNWGNTLTAIGSLGYLVSLVLLLIGSEKARWVFVPSIAASLVGMPIAAYPVGELNALYDLTMYGSGLLNGAIAVLIHLPDS